ncbi:MAG: patatin-like phospholipase family protein [Hyphomonadaceae bacterium]|nr:patatin-like phospholipase family protein [Hyphomonadaceae bacterium]
MGSRKRTLEQRLFSGGPKRILALDGGGVRGIVSAGILAELERRLAARSGRKDFRLCEYFDLIGGTSTGAILAAGLALGKSCAEAADLYREIAPDVFNAKGANAGIRKPRFDAFRLENALARALGDHELASPAFKTGLAIFAKRVDTGSAWTLTNNPRAKYWDGTVQGATPNKRLLVRKLVQASAAAPTFFEEVGLKLDQDGAAAVAHGLFVDGAIAGLNNPALQLFKVATLKSYGFGWPAGEDQILMISVGTGYWRQKLDAHAAGGTLEGLAPVALRAVEALKTMIHDTGVSTVATMQSLSRPPRPWRIDGELEDMREDHLSPFPLLTFQRMDVTLEPADLAALSLEYAPDDVARMRDLATDDPATIERLHEIGLRTGQSYFRSTPGREARDWEQLILPPRFDPAFFAERALGQPKTRLDAMGRFFERPPRPGE